MHISYIFWCNNFKFGVWMLFVTAGCHMPFLGHCDLDPDLVFWIIMSGACLLYNALEIPNLVCECILGGKSVPSHFRVTLTLTSDRVSRIGIKFCAYLWGRNLKICVWMHLGMEICRVPLKVTLTLTSDLDFRIIVFNAFLLYYYSQESQIWCVVASWDGRV